MDDREFMGGFETGQAGTPPGVQQGPSPTTPSPNSSSSAGTSSPPQQSPAGPSSPPPQPPTAASSSPPPGKKDSRLWLWILLGIVGALLAVVIVLLVMMLRTGTAEVPDLTGLSLTEGVTALEQAELKLGEVTYSSDVPAGIEAGQIMTQEPGAGVQVAEGTLVDIVVAGMTEVEVPDVVGMTLDEATTALTDVGLKVKSVEAQDDSEAGVIIDQSPQAGSSVAPGAEVTVTVSAGPGQASVPNVVGKSQDEAAAALQQAGFEVESQTTYDDRVEPGIVLSQAPEAGTAADPGTLVTIVVSNGKNPEAKVPDVVGKGEADAAKILQDAGFQVVPASSYSGSVPVGVVISQDPQAGATALLGSAVTMTVSLGPEPPKTATVPDVVGKTEAEATQLLKQAGYQAAAARAYSDTIAKDVVVEQVPVAGSVTEPGLTVGIVVSDGPRPDQGFVVVPDVTGMTLEEATSVLAQAGLKVVSFEWFTQLAPEGEIFAQLPPPGYSAAPESAVLVIVSKGPYQQVNPL